MASEHTIFRIASKPIRFSGQLLGGSSICDDDVGDYTRVRLFKTDGGTYIWAWDLSWSDEPEDDEELLRADALVVDATSAGTPAELAQLAWEKRPRENARLTEASTRAFHAAADADRAVGDVLYERVE